MSNKLHGVATLIYIMIVLPIISVIFWNLMSWIISVSSTIGAVILCIIVFYIFFCLNILGFCLATGEICVGKNYI